MRRLLTHLLRSRSRLAPAARAALHGARGLEVGGPSRIFGAKGRLPVYPVLGSLDGLDFAAGTPRRPDRDAGEGFVWAPGRRPGRLLLGEAAAPPRDAGPFTAVLASHVLEHVANPLAALDAWQGLVGPGGWLLLVLPHREGTFDHRRPVTSLDHLREDRLRGTPEDDRTHVEEVVALHDLARDPGTSTREELTRRCHANAGHRLLHHHVFDTELAARAVAETGWSLRGVDVMRPYHVAVLATVPEARSADESVWWGAEAPWRRGSPFAGDRATDSA